MDMFKILIILSQDSLGISRTDNKNDIFMIDYLYSPAREQLEKQLLSVNYDFVIPCIPTSIVKLNTEDDLFFEYNILDVLDKFEINTLGNSMITSMILQDKWACLNMSKIGPCMNIYTKYQLENKLEELCEGIEFSPIKIIPLYITNTDANYCEYSNSAEETKKICKKYLTHKNISEILICEKIEFRYKINVTIIGNPPYDISMISVYDSINGTTKTVENTNDYSYLLNKAYELFNLFSLRDFGRFTFEINLSNNNAILTDINGFNCLNQIVLDSALTNLGLSCDSLIKVFLLIYLIRKNEIDKNRLSVLYKGLPNDIIKKIIPLEIQNLLDIEYDYTTVCCELSKRFLHPNEHNKYELGKMLESALNNLSIDSNPQAPFIGKVKNKYEFLEKYEQIPNNLHNQQLILNDSLKIFEGMMRYHSSSMLYNINPPTMFNTIVVSAITNLYNPNAAAKQTSAGILSMEKQIIRQLSDLVGWNTGKSAGLFTTGGKICISYGIKCGLNRCKNSRFENEPVVITSEINHFSIESVCYQLGLSRTSCKRVATTSQGIIDYNELSKVLNDMCKKNVPIACIIVSGGNTTHCPFENVNTVKEIVAKMVLKHNLTYTPYIYYDLVVGWPWLFFKNYNFAENSLHIEEKTLNKIKKSTQILEYAKLADGIGIDFHKAGFSPFANSTFLSQEDAELFSLLDADIAEKHREPYHYCFANSRSSTAIVSTWNILQSTGILGFQSYIANLLHVTDIFIEKLPEQGFEIISPEYTYGFTTIIWLCDMKKEMDFKSLLKQNKQSIYDANKYIFEFSEFLKNNSDTKYCVRFLPKYCKAENQEYVGVLALLPMTPYINEQEAVNISKNLGKHKLPFDKIYSKDSFNDSDMPEEVPK